MYSQADLRWEAQQALNSVWFVQRLEEIERTDLTLSLRLYVRPDLFVKPSWVSSRVPCTLR